MAKSSFYGNSPQPPGPPPPQAPGTPPSGVSKARSSFYETGGIYQAIENSDGLLAQLQAAVATATAMRETGFGLGISVPGAALAASEWLFGHEFDVAVSFAANMAGSLAKAGAAATGSPALALLKNGVQFGTLTYSGTTGTFSTPATSFAIGDLLEVTAPVSPDATLARLSVTLFGTRI